MTLDRLRSTFEDSFDDRVGIDPVCFAFEVEKNSVPENSISDRPDVFARNVKPIVQNGTDFPQEDEGLRTAWAGTVPDESHRQCVRIRRPWMCSHGDADGVILDGPRNRNRTYRLTDLKNLPMP